VSPACEKISGYSPEELQARPQLLHEMVHPDDRARWDEHAHAARSDGTPAALEFRVLTKAGHPRWIRHVCRPIYGEQGAFLGIRGSNTDITPRKRAEEERARLVAALESTAEAICITDVRGAVEYVNQAFERVSGYAKDDALGQPLAAVARPAEAAEELLESAFARARRGDIWSGSFAARRRDGTTYHVEATIAPVRGGAGEVVNLVAVSRDVTERVRLESIAEAVNTMDNIGYIFSGIRHELGNPVNSIKMTLSVLAANLEKYSKDQVREYVDRSMSEIARVEYLLRALKSFNMFETPELRPVSMAEFLERFRQLVAGEFERRGIEVKVILHPEVQCAQTDARALQQVLLNLLTNAADALEGREEPKIVINVFRQPGAVVLRVIDNGRGMNEEQRRNLFKPFHTTKQRGTGLGLIITKKMLSKMGGTIEITSERDAGTIVDIVLPEGAR